MLTIFLAILIYLIGCALAYGRLYASEALIDAKYPELPPNDQPSSIDGIIWFSWLSFFVGVFIYFQDERGQPYARLLRFNNQDIREQHLANAQAEKLQANANAIRANKQTNVSLSEAERNRCIAYPESCK